MNNIFYDDYSLSGIGVVVLVSSLFILMMGLVFGAGYKSACVRASIYNKQNQTEYTCSDFFWAESQINSQTQTIKIK